MKWILTHWLSNHCANLVSRSGLHLRTISLEKKLMQKSWLLTEQKVKADNDMAQYCVWLKSPSVIAARWWLGLWHGKGVSREPRRLEEGHWHETSGDWKEAKKVESQLDLCSNFRAMSFGNEQRQWTGSWRQQKHLVDYLVNTKVRGVLTRRWHKRFPEF